MLSQKLSPVAYVSSERPPKFLCTFCCRPVSGQKHRCDCQGAEEYRGRESQLARLGDAQAYLAGHCKAFVVRVSKRTTIVFKSYTEYFAFISDPEFRAEYYRKKAKETEERLAKENLEYIRRMRELEELNAIADRARKELRENTIKAITLGEALKCGLEAVRELHDLDETLWYNDAMTHEDVLTYALENLTELAKKEVGGA